MNKYISLAKRVYYSVQRLYRRITLEYTPASMLCRIKYRKALRSLKNIHSGKRCFIIGNGPSLTPGDLDLIKNEYQTVDVSTVLDDDFFVKREGIIVYKL